MGLTLQDTINFCLTYVEYSPLNAGTNFNPAITIASMVRDTILNAPVGVWPWNRAEFALTGATALVQGTQDYVFSITDFAYLEKISLLSVDGSYGFELKDVYNTGSLGISTTNTGGQAQPNAAAVKFYTPGTNVSIRFLSVPDQAYTGTITYQKLALPFQSFVVASAANAVGGNTSYTGVFNTPSFITGQIAQIAGFANALNNGSFPIVSVSPTILVVANSAGVAQAGPGTAINASWYPIPDSFADIFNNLFLAEAFSVVDDEAGGARYRQRGIAALLSKSSGLSDMQINAFLAQWNTRGMSQDQMAQLRNSQSVQARGI